MLQRLLRWCWLLFALVVPLWALGCAPLTLDRLRALNPLALSAVVCARPAGVPEGVEYWAENFDTGQLVTDIDREALEAFAPRAQAFYQHDGNAPEETLRHLRRSPGLACTNASRVLASRAEMERDVQPTPIKLAIDDALYAELFDFVDELKESVKPRKPDPRHVAQAVDLRGPHQPVFSPEEVNKFLTLVGRALKEGSPVSASPELPSVDDPAVQTLAGVGAGVSISLVPMGSVGADVAERAGALPPPTKHFRLGKDLGQLLGGIGQIVVGCGGIGLGTGATASGGGAPVGFVIAAESGALLANGWANVCVATNDGIQVMLHWRDDATNTATTQPTTQQQPTTQAPQQPSAKPTEPAKTNGAPQTKTVTRVKQKASEGTEKKPPPNPHGSRGGPEHQRVVKERIEQLKAEGHTHRGGATKKEEVVKVKDGIKQSRRPDITTRAPDGTIHRENVGRGTKSGDPVARERKALDDIERGTGERPHFTPYNNK